jgi:hypothetical protein
LFQRGEIRAYVAVTQIVQRKVTTSKIRQYFAFAAQPSTVRREAGPEFVDVPVTPNGHHLGQSGNDKRLFEAYWGAAFRLNGAKSGRFRAAQFKNSPILQKCSAQRTPLLDRVTDHEAGGGEEEERRCRISCHFHAEKRATRAEHKLAHAELHEQAALSL